MDWAWRGQCEKCGHVHPRHLPSGNSFWLEHHGPCPKCAGMYVVAMCRQVWVRAVTYVWWNPFLWGEGAWVWEFKKICRLGRDDYFVVPEDD